MGKSILIEDYLGKKYGRLTITGFAGVRGGKSFVECLCECGNKKIAQFATMKKGELASCGCLRRETTSRRCIKNIPIGTRFEKLVVVKDLGIDNKHRHMYECLCDCGNITLVNGGQLPGGNTKSCGCLVYEKAQEKRIKGISGEKYGRLTLVKEMGKNLDRRTLWECQCDCGNTIITALKLLRIEHTQSCGCLQRQRTGDSTRTHGKSKTPEYYRAKVNRRREKKLNLDVAWTHEMQTVIDSLFPVCVVCGSDYRMATDHIKSLDSGYGLDVNNAVRLCINCNSKKSRGPLEKMPIEFRQRVREASEIFQIVWGEQYA